MPTPAILAFPAKKSYFGILLQKSRSFLKTVGKSRKTPKKEEKVGLLESLLMVKLLQPVKLI